MPAKKTVTLDSLATLIAHTAASADKKFAALADDIGGMKGDVADLKTEMIAQFEYFDKQLGANHDRLRDISSEVAVIHRRIERLDEQGASHGGFAREIDHALERIAAIEKHLGLDKKIAA
jgi:hypothetical protein